MKQLKRLKNMLSGGDETEKQKKTEKQMQSETEMKSGETKTNEVQDASESAEIQEATSEPAESAPEGGAEKSEIAEEAEKSDEQAEDIKETEKTVEKSETPKESEKIDKKPQTKRSDRMTLLNGRDAETLTRSDIDENFKQEVIDAGAESVSLCFQCGTCTGACPSGRRTPYRVRQVVRKSLMGFKEDLISDDSLWMCSTCYECQERCPRGIKIVDIVKIARNYASQAGYMAKAHKMTGSYVLKTGHGVPINDATMALRKRVGLNELPPTTHQFPEALEEVQTILKTTKFDSLIGYNWETGAIE